MLLCNSPFCISFLLYSYCTPIALLPIVFHQFLSTHLLLYNLVLLLHRLKEDVFHQFLQMSESHFPQRLHWIKSQYIQSQSFLIHTASTFVQYFAHTKNGIRDACSTRDITDWPKCLKCLNAQKLCKSFAVLLRKTVIFMFQHEMSHRNATSESLLEGI